MCINNEIRSSDNVNLSLLNISFLVFPMYNTFSPYNGRYIIYFTMKSHYQKQQSSRRYVLIDIGSFFMIFITYYY